MQGSSEIWAWIIIDYRNAMSVVALIGEPENSYLEPIKIKVLWIYRRYNKYLRIFWVIPAELVVNVENLNKYSGGYCPWSEAY